MPNNSYGAESEFYIDFDGTLQELGTVLSKGLKTPEFWYDTDMEPPHEWLGYCEVLGFEIEIKKIGEDESNTYLFNASTEDCFDEIAEGRMHDLSVWFSNYITKVCNLRTSMKLCD